MRGYFTAEIVVDFDKSDDDGTAARDALNEYIDSHDVSEAFELDKIESDEPHTNELLQRTVIEALENGGYTIQEIRENVDTAIERVEQYRADNDN